MSDLRPCAACGRTLEFAFAHCPWCGARAPRAPVPLDELLGATLDDRYVIRRRIGQGGMATVYEAHQIWMDRTVALKVMRQEIASRPSALERFVREAQAAGRLRHSNTITVYDLGRSSAGITYMAMELLSGVSLGSVLASRVPLDPARVVHIGVQICNSLDEAHAAGLVHRDIKPDNVFLCVERGRSDHVKVLDFGIVKVLDDRALSHLTRSGTVPGTPGFIAPEVCCGQTPSPSADLYGLGATLYECLAGRAPLSAPSPVELCSAHVHDPVPHLSAVAPGVAPELAAVVHRLLAKAPGDRPASAAATAAALIDALNRMATVDLPRAAPRVDADTLEVAPISATDGLGEDVG